MNGPLSSGEDVALFIDWENFKISLASGHRTPNVSALKEEVSNHGRVVVARAYADWVTRTPEFRGASQFILDPPALYAAGIEPVYVPTRLAPTGTSAPGRTIRVKNSVDVKMTADCIEIAHSYPNIGTYVLVSGDSDFIHVINALRTMGKRVIIIGVSWATSRRLADQVDELILYDQDIDTVAPAEAPVVSDTRAPARTAQAGRLDLAEIISAIEEIVRNERLAGGTPLLTSIKQRLLRRYPTFDEKNVGFSGFKKLMARVAQEGNIRLITAGLVDWAIMADEPEPEEAGAVATPSDGQGSPAEVAAPRTTARRWRPGWRRRKSSAGQEAEVVEPVEPTEALSPDGVAQETEEIASAEAESVPAGAAGAADTGLDVTLADSLRQLDLPEGPNDGQDAQRVADLIVMADTLENQAEVSHVAFNFLVTEVCQALDAGLKAENEEVTQRWGQALSRLYVTKMVRGLGEGNLFEKGWHSEIDETSGRTRRLRTFYLNRNHPLVDKVLRDHWGPQGYAESVTVSAERPVLAEPPPEAEFSKQPIESAETPATPEIPFFSRLFRPRR